MFRAGLLALTPAPALHQVCAMRLPVEVLQAHLGAMLQGLLLWSEDTKNKFRLKVREGAVERA